MLPQLRRDAGGRFSWHGKFMTSQAGDLGVGNSIPSLPGYGGGLESRDHDGGDGHSE